MREEIRERGAGCVHVAEDERTVLSWTVHLARRQPRKLLGVFTAVFLVAASAYFLFNSIFPVIIMPLALLAAVSDYLLPTTYRLTNKAANAYNILSGSRIEWSAVKRINADDRGAKLSAFERPCRFGERRGMYLRFDGNGSEVINTVERLRCSSDD
jgi:hypothetical protein